MWTTTRTNHTRERHLARAAALAALTVMLAAPGLCFAREIVLASTFIRTDAAATVVWTLWSLPVVCLGGACAAALLAGARAAPAHRWPNRANRRPMPLKNTRARSPRTVGAL